MNDFKTAASRRLNNAFPAERGRTRWTRHGSTRYLWTEDAVAEKVHYVLRGQGEPMERFPDPGAAPLAPEPGTQHLSEPRTQRSGVSGPE